MSGARQFDFINVLESLLLVVAYHNRVNVRFTRKFCSLDDVVQFARDRSVRLILDCTGGRLRYSSFGSHSLTWERFAMSDGDYKLKLLRDSRNDRFRYVLCHKGVPQKTTVVALRLLGEDLKEFRVGNIFAYPINKDDMALMQTYHNRCLSLDNYMKVAQRCKTKQLRRLLPRSLLHGMSRIQKSDIRYVKVRTFHVTAHHAPFAAKQSGPTWYTSVLGTH